MKKPRGFYKDFKSYKKQLRERPKYLEFLLKHTVDPEKTIQFYIDWTNLDEFVNAMELIRSTKSDGYEADMWMRYHNTPRTRKEKAVHRSRMSGLHHLNDLRQSE